MRTNSKIILIVTVLLTAGCGKSSPMDAAGDQIADAILKTHYARANELTQLETRAKTELDMSARQLVSQCAVAAMKYVKVSDAQIAPVVAQVINPTSSDEALKQMAGGVSNHAERCIALPNAYDVGKQQ